MFLCLIPSTRNVNLLATAVDSAKIDGWDVETIRDIDYQGVHKIREALLNRAFVYNNIQFIRYLDDDDILLPHREHIQEAFQDPKIDIVYTDAMIKMPSGNELEIRYTGNPLKDIMDIHPWSWIARAEALKNIKRIFGYVWNYEHRSREGGYCWLQFLLSSMKIKHVPVLGYQYNKSFDPACLSQDPHFQQNTEKLRRHIEKHFHG